MKKFLLAAAVRNSIVFRFGVGSRPWPARSAGGLRAPTRTVRGGFLYLDRLLRGWQRRWVLGPKGLV